MTWLNAHGTTEKVQSKIPCTLVLPSSNRIRGCAKSTKCYSCPIFIDELCDQEISIITLTNMKYLYITITHEN